MQLEGLGERCELPQRGRGLGRSPSLNRICCILALNKKSELMVIRRARAYSSFCLQVILVYLQPLRRYSLFGSQKWPTKNH